MIHVAIEDCHGEMPSIDREVERRCSWLQMADPCVSGECGHKTRAYVCVCVFVVHEISKLEKTRSKKDGTFIGEV